MLVARIKEEKLSQSRNETLQLHLDVALIPQHLPRFSSKACAAVLIINSNR